MKEKDEVRSRAQWKKAEEELTISDGFRIARTSAPAAWQTSVQRRRTMCEAVAPRRASGAAPHGVHCIPKRVHGAGLTTGLTRRCKLPARASHRHRYNARQAEAAARGAAAIGGATLAGVGVALPRALLEGAARTALALAGPRNVGELPGGARNTARHVIMEWGA